MNIKRNDLLRSCSFILLFLCVFLISGCRAVPEFDDGTGEKKNIDWNASNITKALAGNDPVEPFNRAMFACTDFCMHYIVRPVGYVYGSILPREVIKRIDYAADNLAFPSRMFSCLLQGQFKGSGVELLRFLTNSTIGLAGFFDPADAWFGLERRNEDFGQAFGYWNIGPGCYFILPFFASSNIRDTAGVTFDRATDVKSYIPYVGYLTSVNSAVNSYDTYNSLTESACDAYETAKVLRTLMRYAQVENFHHKLVQMPPSDFGKRTFPQIAYQGELVKAARIYGAQNPLVDTLKGAFFRVKKNNAGWWIKTSLWNSDFVPEARTETVHLMDGEDSKDEMIFQIWYRKEKPDAPLVLLLPGAGGHYRAGMLQALAEIYYDKGCSVAVLANSLNPEFFIPASLGLPGDVPRDTAKVRIAFKKILEKIRTDLKLSPSRIISCGYSLGGVHTLHLAAQEEKEGNPLKIDRYIAINPPADLFYALKTMDSFCDIPRNMTGKEFFEFSGDAVMKIFLASSGRKGMLGILRPANRKVGIRDAVKKAEKSSMTKEGEKEKSIKWTNPVMLPLSPEQAGWLSGYYMRLELRELLFAAQKNSPDGKGFLKTPYTWGRRTPLYDEIDSYNWMGYAEKILLPFLKKQDDSLTLEKLGERASLLKISSTLEHNPRVRVLHNLDDPLLSDKDILFLDRTLKKKLVWFDCGGHLGNMFLPVFREKLSEAAFGEMKKAAVAGK
ncbi:MAG: VacJ family lipoprotein [Lentisphaeria bacterium]|nr:VacJ family lipoprotein [Lentisphaeria bacterium]